MGTGCCFVRSWTLTGKSTLNGDAKVGIVHINIDNSHAEERRFDAANSNHRKFGDCEAKETGSSDGDSDKDDTSGDDSAERRATKKVEDEDVATTDGLAENRCREDVEVGERTPVDGIAENGTQQEHAEKEKTGEGDNVVQNVLQGEDASNDGWGLADDVVGSSTSEEEESRQVRPCDAIRSSLRKPSNSGPQAPPKKVKWTENLVEVHEYVRDKPEDISPCACVIL